MKQKLLRAGIRWFAGGFFREIYEGKRGPTLQRWALWAKGKKTKTGGLLALLLTIVAALRPDLLNAIGAEWLGLASGVLITGGLVDKAWWKQSAPTFVNEVLHTILSFGPLASALVGFGAELLPRIPNCASCADWVATLQLWALAIGSATAWLAARLAAPPKLATLDNLEDFEGWVELHGGEQLDVRPVVRHVVRHDEDQEG